jgi:hypothetical protein
MPKKGSVIMFTAFQLVALNNHPADKEAMA